MNFSSTGSLDRSGLTAPPDSTANGQAGFALLEAVVALVILALAVVALLQSHTQGLRAIAVNNEAVEAGLLARSLLEQKIGGRGELPDNGEGKWGAYHWRTETAPVVEEWARIAEKPQWVLYRFSVIVQWRNNRSLHVDTFKLAPPP